jgi:hypothetical protein
MKGRGTRTETVYASCVMRTPIHSWLLTDEAS